MIKAFAEVSFFENPHIYGLISSKQEEQIDAIQTTAIKIEQDTKEGWALAMDAVPSMLNHFQVTINSLQRLSMLRTRGERGKFALGFLFLLLWWLH